jgi:excisionase family DNA binding protein
MSDHATTTGTDTLLTVREVAALLRLSESCVYTMTAAGQLPHLRVGNGRGSIRFLREDIDRFLSGCRTAPLPAPPPPPVHQSLKHLKLPRR